MVEIADTRHRQFLHRKNATFLLPSPPLLPSTTILSPTSCFASLSLVPLAQVGTSLFDDFFPDLVGPGTRFSVRLFYSTAQKVPILFHKAHVVGKKRNLCLCFNRVREKLLVLFSYKNFIPQSPTLCRCVYMEVLAWLRAHFTHPLFTKSSHTRTHLVIRVLKELKANFSLVSRTYALFPSFFFFRFHRMHNEFIHYICDFSFHATCFSVKRFRMPAWKWNGKVVCFQFSLSKTLFRRNSLL